MVTSKEEHSPLEGRRAKRDKARWQQQSPVALLAVALAGGIGYFAWKWWQEQEEEDNKEGSLASATASSGNNGGASTSGRATATEQRQARSRQNSRPQEKPKSQKQLRKESKQSKKDSKMQASRGAEAGGISAAIAKRAKGLGMGAQPPEPQRETFVDYEGVAKAMDKIVEWQQTGKKKF